MGGTSDSDSSCSESAAADTSAGKACCMWRWGSFPSGGDVGGGQFAARTVAVRSYPLSGVPPIYLKEPLHVYTVYYSTLRKQGMYSQVGLVNTLGLPFARLEKKLFCFYFSVAESRKPFHFSTKAEDAFT